MTVQEAISWLDNMCDKAKQIVDCSEYTEALDMAVQALLKPFEELDGALNHALEQLPCDDAISRQDLIGTMHAIMDDAVIGDEDENYECLDDVKQQYIEIAKGMRSVKPKARWIPVSEELPKIGLYVLAYLNPEIEKRHSIIISSRDSKNKKYWTDGTILAWMPLPEPYMGG